MKIFSPLLLFLLLSLSLIKAQNRISQQNHPLAWGAAANTYSGNLYVQLPILQLVSTDLPIEVRLHYNSDQFEQMQQIGLGWSLDPLMSYRKESGNVILSGVDGQKREFTLSGSELIAPVGSFDSLQSVQDSIILTKVDGTQWIFADSVQKQLSLIRNRNGQQIDFTYDGTHLTDQSVLPDLPHHSGP
ncbi:MAG: hypothetical protein AAFP02_26815, partial [Bacteroidota bacterium]